MDKIEYEKIVFKRMKECLYEKESHIWDVALLISSDLHKQEQRKQTVGIKANDKVFFDGKTGIVVVNDKEREILIIKALNSNPWFTVYPLEYVDMKRCQFTYIGVSKYETIYKPAFVAIVGAYGFYHFFGAAISSLLSTIALGTGIGVAFILAKNFKRIKNFQFKKNITILEPIKEPVKESEDYHYKMTSVDKEGREIYTSDHFTINYLENFKEK